ncbi:MAG TPA: alpha/beta fold hydrolase [Thermoanaerobaculia bacterium]|nr:alpha/beta fold hydrolase [Thermoanaerobaculia bacterium]
MKSLTVLGFAAILLTTSCATPSGPPAEAVPPSYTSMAGEIPVGVIPAGSLRDAERDRRLELSIDYPAREGSYPVVVFVTGFGAPSRSYVGLSSYWASHGYVVIKVGHPESRPDVTDLAEVWRDQTPAEWRSRARDISLVIDSFTQLEQQYPELKGKMDPARIGVGGHSYGAFTTMLLAGARTFDGVTAATYADARVRASLAMSPQGPGERGGLTTESWREVRIPTMYMTGTADRGVTEEEDETWRRQAFELSPPGDKWFVSLGGAGHFAFAGRLVMPEAIETTEPAVPSDPRDPRDPRTRGPLLPTERTAVRRVDAGFYSDRARMNVIRTVALAFWDAYLKDEAAGREYLSALSTRGDMTVESK